MAKKDKQDLEAEVWNAITAFEQILEAMPNDRASLEALSHAYEQIGDLTKAREYFLRLGQVLLDEGDVAGAGDILERLKGFAADDEDAADLVRRIEEAGGASQALVDTAEISPDAGTEAVPSEVQPEAKPKKPKKKSVSTAFNMAEELAMAWNLMEANELTQEEYASVVQDLTEMSAGDSVATISVLHVLEARGFKGIERVVSHLAEACSTPFVSLSNFDIQPESMTLMPMDFVVSRGAVVFELISHDALAVVMNPYDKQLRKDVESLVERRCHFYITMPAEFDQAAEKAAEEFAELAKELDEQ